MENYVSRINELRNVRRRNIKKLTKILNLLVKTEWEVNESALKSNDNTCNLASKSIANASAYIQTAISQLISTDINQSINKKNENNNSSISSLKKVVLNKK